MKGERAPNKSCPNCGMTLSRFRESGLLGCAECYRAFREEILSAVLKVQGKVRHVREEISPEEIKRELGLQKKVLQDRFRQALNEESEGEAIELESEIEELDRSLEEKEPAPLRTLRQSAEKNSSEGEEP